MTIMKKMLTTVAAMSMVLGAGLAEANTLRFAFQGDAQSLDPHGLNETFTLGFLSNVYEGLTLLDDNLKLQPGLATSWEVTSPTTIVFKLREGVKFHNGNSFNADDVIFSWKRTLSEGSDQKVRGGMVADIKKIDDLTVEVHTKGPQPLMPSEWAWIYMMDKEWAEEHGAVNAANVKEETANGYSLNHSNGTGPFEVVSRQPDVKTVFKRSENHWNTNVATNVTEVIFTPVKQAATRTAALISGELDMVYPIPVQDWSRLDSEEGVSALRGAEARTIFLGMDQMRDELLYSNIKGKNPLKDIRVRKALAHALNLEVIKKKIMRGASTPSGLMIAPQVNGHNQALNTPYAYDPELSKKLLAEAGYPDGFEITIDCPNNRYVNDEKICQAAAAMMAKVGIDMKVLAQPKAKYFAKVLAQNNYDTSMYLLGWTPGSMDVHNVLEGLLSCQDKENNVGLYNLGNYCNARVDELTKLIQVETDAVKRQAYVDEAMQIAKDEVAYLPIHQQPLSWGISDKITVNQRADNAFDFRYVVFK
uniref:ABC transporter substrate-binding protein n=1 Tax=OCS116 cluster bacterium TaxID=2030921 RepID=A0A2A4Z409_9PROT